jgi:hypothetical protein
LLWCNVKYLHVDHYTARRGAEINPLIGEFSERVLLSRNPASLCKLPSKYGPE